MHVQLCPFELRRQSIVDISVSIGSSAFGANTSSVSAPTEVTVSEDSVALVSSACEPQNVGSHERSQYR